MNTVHNCKNHKTTDTNQLDKNSKLVQGQTKLNKKGQEQNSSWSQFTHTHTHTKLPGVKGVVLDGWALTRWHVGHHAMLSVSCQATNHIKPHLPAHRPQPMGCFCLPVYLKTNQLQRHNAKNRRPLHIVWPVLNVPCQMCIKAAVMTLLHYCVRLWESSIRRCFCIGCFSLAHLRTADCGTCVGWWGF